MPDVHDFESSQLSKSHDNDIALRTFPSTVNGLPSMYVYVGLEFPLDVENPIVVKILISLLDFNYLFLRL